LSRLGRWAKKEGVEITPPTLVEPALLDRQQVGQRAERMGKARQSDVRAAGSKSGNKKGGPTHRIMRQSQITSRSQGQWNMVKERGKSAEHENHD